MITCEYQCENEALINVIAASMTGHQMRIYLCDLCFHQWLRHVIDQNLMERQKVGPIKVRLTKSGFA